MGCDQVSKSIVRSRLSYHEQIELIDEHFILTKVENTGAFLSMGSTLSDPLRNILLLILPSIALVVAMGILLINTTINRGLVLGLCFILGGGIGNMVDRIAYGSVTDFLHIDLNFVRTGVFNMADVSIMIGVFVTLIWYNKK